METTNRNYDINYDTFYQNNNAIIFCYKSNRKNSSSSDVITINRLTSKDTDRTVSDDRIINQIAGTIEKIVYYCKQYKHIELSCYVDVSKQADFINANSEVYHDTENQRYSFQRVTFSSIEQCISFVFSVYCLIYPYNKISKKHYSITLASDTLLINFIIKGVRKHETNYNIHTQSVTAYRL